MFIWSQSLAGRGGFGSGTGMPIELHSGTPRGGHRGDISKGGSRFVVPSFQAHLIPKDSPMPMKQIDTGTVDNSSAPKSR